jgi:hypothetical protein
MDEDDRSRKSTRTARRVNRQARIARFQGRPERDKIISPDDTANLLIALNTCMSFEEFLDEV